MNTTCSFAYTGRKARHCRTWTALGPGRRQRQSLLIHDSGPRRRRRNEPSPEQLHLTTADRLFVDGTFSMAPRGCSNNCTSARRAAVGDYAVMRVSTTRSASSSFFAIVSRNVSVGWKLCKCAEVYKESQLRVRRAIFRHSFAALCYQT